MKEELGVIQQLVYGYTEQGIGLTMMVRLLESSPVLFLDKEKVDQLLTDLRLGNIMALQNQSCAVNIDEENNVTFNRLV